MQSTTKQPVYLRVYDISDGAARTWSIVLLGKRIEGIWHTGLEFCGMEYFYGGGIVKMRPSEVEATYGINPFRVHHLGVTTITPEEFEGYLLSVQSNFTRDCYDLVKWNCNNFTDHAAQYLLKRGIPAYILDLPEDVTNTFMGKILVNFIKMFSDAPAIDSEDANHPKQKLAIPSNHYSKGRRNSCPGSPTTRAGSGKQLTAQEQASLNALRRPRAGSTVSLTSKKWKNEAAESKVGRTGSLDWREQEGTSHANFRRSSVPTLAFNSLFDQGDSGSTASSSLSGTPPNFPKANLAPLPSARIPRGSLPPRMPQTARTERAW